MSCRPWSHQWEPLCHRCYSLNLAFQSGERAETHQLLKSNPGRWNILPHSHKQRLVIDLLTCSFCLTFFLPPRAIASVLVEWENIITRIFSWPASGADLAGKTHFTLTVISQRSRDRRTTARSPFNWQLRRLSLSSPLLYRFLLY